MRRSAWMPGAASVSAAGTAASRAGVSWATATEAVPTESRAAETAAADISFRRREGEVRKGLPFVAVLRAARSGGRIASSVKRRGGEPGGRGPARRGGATPSGVAVGELWGDGKEKEGEGGTRGNPDSAQKAPPAVGG